MLHDISPQIFRNEFYIKTPNKDDFALFYEDNQVLLMGSDENLSIPTFQELEIINPEIYKNCDYLFAIDDHAFYLVSGLEGMETPEFKKHELQIFRTLQPMWLGFAGITGSQLYRFYNNNQFCGRCGHSMRKSTKERALCCDQCKNIAYPKISPAVIVAITDKDRILMTRYTKGVYTRYGLVAGFVEFGESLEQTVEREVMEEVGLKVKNIRYYKNQPWSFSDSLLVGYFAEVDGSNEITLDECELAEATWFSREDIPVNPLKISLTNEMIEAFRNREI